MAEINTDWGFESLQTDKTSGDENGKHAGLRCPCLKKLEGSIPSLTIKRQMAELVDALGRGPSVRKDVWVRVPL